MEAKVKRQHRDQHKFNIDGETLCCILDIGSSHAHDTKHGKIIDLYWHTKFMFPRVLGEKQFESMNIKRQIIGI